MAYYCPLQIFFKYFSAFAKNADVPAMDDYCPRTYLPRKITVRRRTCSELLLSADEPAAH